MTNLGVLRRLALYRNDQVLSVHLLENGESEDAFRKRAGSIIQREYEADVRATRARVGLVDSPMRWLKGTEAEDLGNQPLRFPPRLRFDFERKTWVAMPELRERQWPVSISAEAARAAVESALPPRKGISPRRG